LAPRIWFNRAFDLAVEIAPGIVVDADDAAGTETFRCESKNSAPSAEIDERPDGGERLRAL
jgi:hypothetical protein